MKIKIEAVVYKLLYEELREKFYNEFCSPGDDKESKIIWEVGSKGNIAVGLFQLKNPYYFFRKYEEQAKQHIEVDYPLYPMTVDREQMVLALKYLLLGKDFETISNFQKLTVKDYESWDWKKKYDTLLDLFVKRYFPDGIADSNQKDSDSEIKESNDIGGIFLDVVANNFKAFYPKKLIRMLDDFFEFLTSKKYYDAWILLSPSLQRSPLWMGGYRDFCKAHQIVDTIEIERIIPDFKYTYKEVFFEIECQMTGLLYDFPAYVEKIKNEYGAGTLNETQYKSATYFFTEVYFGEKFGLNVDKSVLRDRVNFVDMDKDQLLDYKFHQAFSVMKEKYLGTLDQFVIKKNAPYVGACSMDVSFAFIDDRWFIHTLEIKEYKTEQVLTP